MNSQIVLDEPGAEQLLGRGDLLYNAGRGLCSYSSPCEQNGQHHDFTSRMPRLKRHGLSELSPISRAVFPVVEEFWGHSRLPISRLFRSQLPFVILDDSQRKLFSAVGGDVLGCSTQPGFGLLLGVMFGVLDSVVHGEGNRTVMRKIYIAASIAGVTVLSLFQSHWTLKTS
jgi:hypothetical protein